MKPVHWIAGCHTCGKRWEGRNAVPVAARHSKVHEHQTWAEVGLVAAWDKGVATL